MLLKRNKGKDVDQGLDQEEDFASELDAFLRRCLAEGRLLPSQVEEIRQFQRLSDLRDKQQAQQQDAKEED